jgi:hypothetical protein
MRRGGGIVTARCLLLVLALCRSVLAADPDALEPIDELPSETGGFTLPHNVWIGGDITLGAERPRGQFGKFGLETMSLLVRWDPLPRLSFFTELRVEDAFEKFEGEAATSDGVELAVERIYAEMLVTPSLTVRLGKVFTPFGLWNPVHRAPLTWALEEPAIADEIVPVETTGLTLLYRTRWRGWSLDTTLYGPIQDVLRHPEVSDKGWIVGGRIAAGRPIGSAFATVGLNTAAFRPFDERAWTTATGIDLELNLWRHQISSELIFKFTSDGARPTQGAYLQDAIPLDWLTPLARDLYGVLRAEYFQPPHGGAAVGGLVGFFWRPVPNLILRAGYLWGSRSVDQLLPGTHGSISLIF